MKFLLCRGKQSWMGIFFDFFLLFGFGGKKKKKVVNCSTTHSYMFSLFPSPALSFPLSLYLFQLLLPLSFPKTWVVTFQNSPQPSGQGFTHVLPTACPHLSHRVIIINHPFWIFHLFPGGTRIYVKGRGQWREKIIK